MIELAEQSPVVTNWPDVAVLGIIAAGVCFCAWLYCKYIR